MRVVFILFFLVCSVTIAQGDIIAKEYFKNGKYEKALVEYKKLYARAPSNITYINQIISTYQQLEQYEEAEIFILKLIKRINYPAFYVELGYNFELKNNKEQAQLNYQKGLVSIDDKVTNVFTVARSFQNHSLLEEAALAYEKAMVLKPDFNFNVQLAQIYGEQGNIDKMFNSYLNYAEFNPAALKDVKRAINDFISEDAYSENNVLLRKNLLKRLQEEPNTLWNATLSWLFIQQKDFKKAFIQEKAIFNREQGNLDRVLELASIAANEEAPNIAKEIYGYVIETAQDAETKLKAHFSLLQLNIASSDENDYGSIKTQYLELLNTFGTTPETLELQLSYAHFLAFYMNETDEAISFLENLMEAPLSRLEKAQVKLELGDVLVLKEAFNKALIYYTQIQRNLKNSTISQEARFKVAKASYYKGDFKWAESQLKILKASTSQLIANDALDLKLLISDNKYEDSLQTALKLYAKADLLSYQNRNDEAIAILSKILEAHKTEPIIAQTLYKQAQLFELKSQYDQALVNYEAIIENYRDGVLIDDAYFHLGIIYEKYLNMPEKAKAVYEKIVFNHADSIYFIEARKRFRKLRGDAIN
ncbi:tetratricopeptide repeat protein [Cognatitamlana onchidii]|uniref:tetratricopeptide repeat protein n=1 Tax=Cognatitamlana onchidii TaxID=2562860 RepID=UPI0010A62514|nr:tetratricopeptide repeat protein [Algibacter onchidii]